MTPREVDNAIDFLLMREDSNPELIMTASELVQAAPLPPTKIEANKVGGVNLDWPKIHIVIDPDIPIQIHGKGYDAQSTLPSEIIKALIWLINQ